MTARRRAGRGQSLVEFALVIPIFLLLLCAIIDGGRLVFAYNQMSQVTRAVARVASTACFDTTPACDRASGPIAASIAAQAAGSQTPVTWTVSCLAAASGTPRTTGIDGCRVGDIVRVSVTGAFSPITPIASSLGSMNVGSTTQQEILQ